MNQVVVEESRQGKWFQTYSGLRFYPFDPRPDDVRLVDVARSLSRICRYGGHSLRFYSVAQHSIWVSQHVPADLALCGLMHDAHEAYTGDVINPIKVGLRALVGDACDKVADRVQDTITSVLGGYLPAGSLSASIVKEADLRALATERRDLLRDTGEKWFCGGFGPDPVEIQPVESETAMIMFLNRYEDLRRKSA